MCFAIFLLVIWLGGCVETAQCDEYVGCPEGQACYQHRCLQRCDGGEQCPSDLECRVCTEEQEEGGARCPEGEVRVCMERSDGGR